MLTLSRKEGEKLILTIDGKQIAVISLDQIQGKQAKVTIAVLDDVKIQRKELAECYSG